MIYTRNEAQVVEAQCLAALEAALTEQGATNMAVTPVKDTTSNDYSSQVVGNKEDTAVTTAGTTSSLMAYLKGLITLTGNGETVQAADATDNTYSKDVVGNKTDAAVSAVGTTRSLVAYIKGVVTAVCTTLPGLHAVPTADATTNANARDVIGNKTDAAVTAKAANKSLVGYVKGILDWIGTLANTGGTASLGAILGDFSGTDLVTRLGTLLTATGISTTFVVKKTLTSSAVVQTGVDVTAASTGGALELLNVILQTNGTGLAVGTNFTLESNNANGAAVFMAETVANLGASKTVDLSTASVTKQKFILESGKKIIAKSTVADCTGAGTIDVYFVFRRNAAGASIAAA